VTPYVRIGWPVSDADSAVEGHSLGDESEASDVRWTSPDEDGTLREG
jgi:hypothetical protein